MYAISLGDDGAELRPLEPWHAEEFLAHLDRGREFITRHIPFGVGATDVDSARAVLRTWADKRATDNGGLHGLWLDGKLVGGVLFRVFDAVNGTCEVGCWLEPAGSGRGSSPARCGCSSTGRLTGAASTVWSGGRRPPTNRASRWRGDWA